MGAGRHGPEVGAGGRWQVRIVVERARQRRPERPCSGAGAAAGPAGVCTSRCIPLARGADRVLTTPDQLVAAGIADLTGARAQSAGVSLPDFSWSRATRPPGPPPAGPDSGSPLMGSRAPAGMPLDDRVCARRHDRRRPFSSRLRHLSLASGPQARFRHWGTLCQTPPALRGQTWRAGCTRPGRRSQTLARRRACRPMWRRDQLQWRRVMTVIDEKARYCCPATSRAMERLHRALHLPGSMDEATYAMRACVRPMPIGGGIHHSGIRKVFRQALRLTRSAPQAAGGCNGDQTADSDQVLARLCTDWSRHPRRCACAADRVVPLPLQPPGRRAVLAVRLQSPSSPDPGLPTRGAAGEMDGHLDHRRQHWGTIRVMRQPGRSTEGSLGRGAVSRSSPSPRGRNVAAGPRPDPGPTMGFLPPAPVSA